MLSDRSAIMVRGKITAMGEPARLAALHGGKTKVIIHRASDKAKDVLMREFTCGVLKVGKDLCVFASSREEVAKLINKLYSAGLDEEVEIRQPSLEDAFLNIVGVNIVGARITEEGSLDKGLINFDWRSSKAVVQEQGWCVLLPSIPAYASAHIWDRILRRL